MGGVLRRTPPFGSGDCPQIGAAVGGTVAVVADDADVGLSMAAHGGACDDDAEDDDGVAAADGLKMSVTRPFFHS